MNETVVSDAPRERCVLVKFKLGIHEDIAKKYLGDLGALHIERGEQNNTYIVTITNEHAATWSRRCAANPMVSFVTFSLSTNTN